MYTIYHYPNCSTCKNAIKFLKENNISYNSFNIVTETPNEIILKDLISKSSLPIKKFFNTSGLKYKELNLKNILPTLSEEEAIKLLASDGMLIKRPLITNEENILIGFKEEIWKNIIK